MIFGIVPEHAHGLWYALRIMKLTRQEWRKWKEMLEHVPEAHRTEAADYLREQARLLIRRGE